MPPAPSKPLVHYNRGNLARAIKRRAHIFLKVAETLRDENDEVYGIPITATKRASNEAKIAMYDSYAAKCYEILNLMDQAKPDEAEKALYNLENDPNMPERPTWGPRYLSLYNHITIAARSIRQRQQ